MTVRPVDLARSTVLFGAGVTRAAGGPTAAELVGQVAQELVSAAKWREWIKHNVQPNGRLRFETVMDDLTSTADPELSLLALLDGLRPGPLHGALARAAAAGARLVTVNFDDLAERAIQEQGLSPRTVDLQEGLNLDGIDAPGAVVKLHGTRVVHGGSDEPGSGPAPLHATISAIVAGGAGAGLPPHIEERLRGLIDGRTLVVVGYSGSDDLDVMPSLSPCRPARAVWVAHAAGSPREVAHRELEPVAARSLLERWVERDAEVVLLRGPTDLVLRELGWAVDEAWGESALVDAQEKWRRHVREWASQAREHDPSGLALVAELNGSLGRFAAAREALLRSVPSDLPHGLWSPQRRLMMLAENAYLLHEDRDEIRRQAEDARVAAAARDDVAYVAAAHHLKARTYRVAREPDLDAAEREISRALQVLVGADELGCEADLELESARLSIARGQDDAAARSAQAAATRYGSIGALVRMAEALQVAGHARALNGDQDEARALLTEARRLADLGPYPDRQVEVHLALASLSDASGETAGSIDHARAAISIALEIGHSEITQAYAMLGLALSEAGAFADAAAAFSAGLDVVAADVDSLEGLLACGAALSLLMLGRPESALDVLSRHDTAIEADCRHAMLAAAIRWRAGPGTMDAVLAAMATVATAGEEPDGETSFGVARLGVPGEDASRFLSRARELIAAEGQRDRLARLESAVAAGAGWLDP